MRRGDRHRDGVRAVAVRVELGEGGVAALDAWGDRAGQAKRPGTRRRRTQGVSVGLLGAGTFRGSTLYREYKGPNEVCHLVIRYPFRNYHL